MSEAIIIQTPGTMTGSKGKKLENYVGIEFTRGASNNGGEHGYHKMIGDEELLKNLPLFDQIKLALVKDAAVTSVLNQTNINKTADGGNVDLTGADGSDANHLIVMTKPNLSPRNFNKLVIEISGITGSNQIPSHQFKNLNCIVPFRKIKEGNLCDIDLTEVLYSWVQTDVDARVDDEQLPPDMIIIHAWGMDIKETKRPVKEVP